MRKEGDSRSFLALLVVALLIVSIFLVLSAGVVSASSIKISGIKSLPQANVGRSDPAKPGSTTTICEDMNDKEFSVFPYSSKGVYGDIRDFLFSDETQSQKVYWWDDRVWRADYTYTTGIVGDSYSVSLSYVNEKVSSDGSPISGSWKEFKSSFIHTSGTGQHWWCFFWCSPMVEDKTSRCDFSEAVVTSSLDPPGTSSTSSHIEHSSGMGSYRSPKDEFTEFNYFEADYCDAAFVKLGDPQVLPFDYSSSGGAKGCRVLFTSQSALDRSPDPFLDPRWTFRKDPTYLIMSYYYRDPIDVKWSAGVIYDGDFSPLSFGDSYPGPGLPSKKIGLSFGVDYIPRSAPNSATDPLLVYYELYKPTQVGQFLTYLPDGSLTGKFTLPAVKQKGVSCSNWNVEAVINTVISPRACPIPTPSPIPETCNGKDDNYNVKIDDYNGDDSQSGKDKLCLSMSQNDLTGTYICDGALKPPRCVLGCNSNADCKKKNALGKLAQRCDLSSPASLTYKRCIDRTVCDNSYGDSCSGAGSLTPNSGCSDPTPFCSGNPSREGCKCSATCVPKKCKDVGQECGSNVYDDGCGKKLDCGDCNDPTTCQPAIGKCVCVRDKNGAQCGSDNDCVDGKKCDDQCKCVSKCDGTQGGKKISSMCTSEQTFQDYPSCACVCDTGKGAQCSGDAHCTGNINFGVGFRCNLDSCTCDPKSVCPNGIKEGAEVCDGSSGCNSDQICKSDCSGCVDKTVSKKCGDGKLNAKEEECEFNVDSNGKSTGVELGISKDVRLKVNPDIGDLFNSLPVDKSSNSYPLFCNDIYPTKPTCNSNCKCVGSSSTAKCGNGVRDGNEGCEFNIDAKGEIVRDIITNKPVEIAITIPPETYPKNCFQRNPNKSICSPPGSKYSGGECQCMPEIKFEEGCTDANSKLTSGDVRHCETQPAPENDIETKDSEIIPAPCDDPEKNNFDSTMGPVIAPSGGSCCSLSTSMDKTKSLNVAVNAYLVIGGKLKLIDTSKLDDSFGGNLPLGSRGHVLKAHGDGTYGGIDSEVMFSPVSTKDWLDGRRLRTLGSIDAYIKYTDGDATTMTCGDTIVSVLIHGFWDGTLNRPTRYCNTTVKGKHIQKGDFVVFGQIDTNGDVKTECYIKDSFGNYNPEGVEGFNKYGPVSLTVLDDSREDCILNNLRWEVDGAKKDGTFTVAIDGTTPSKVEVVADVAKNCEGKNIALKIWEGGMWGGAGGKKPVVSFDNVLPADGKIRRTFVPTSTPSKNYYSFELVVDGKSYKPMSTSLLGVKDPSKNPGSKIRVPISPPVAESVKDNPNANAGTALPVLSKPFTITDGKNEYTCDPLGGIQKFLSENAAAAGSALKIVGSALSLDSFVCSPKVKASGSLGKDLDSLAFIPSDVVINKLNNPFDTSSLNVGDKMIIVDESSIPSVGDKILNEIEYLEFKLPDGYKFKSLDKNDNAVIVQGSDAVSDDKNIKTITATSKPLEDVSPSDVVNAEKVEPSCDILKLPMTMSVTIAGKYNDEAIDGTVTLERLKTPRDRWGNVIVDKKSQFYGYAPIYIGTNKLSGKNSGMNMEVELRYLPSKDNIFEYGSGSTGSKPSTIVSVSFAKDTNPFSVQSSEPTKKYQLETAGIGGGYYIPGTSYTIVNDAATNVAVAFKLATSVCMAACVKQSGKTNYNHYPGLLFLDADRSKYTFETEVAYLKNVKQVLGFTKYQRFTSIPKDYAYGTEGGLPVGICDVETGLGWSSGGERVAVGELDAYNYMNNIYTKNALNNAYTQSFLWMDGTDSTNGKIGSFYMSELPPTVPCFLNILSGDKPFGLKIFDATNDPKEILADMPRYRIDIGGHWGIRSPVIIGAIELFNNQMREPEMIKDNCVKLKTLMNSYFTQVAVRVPRSALLPPWTLNENDRAELTKLLNELDPNGNYNIKKPDDNA